MDPFSQINAAQAEKMATSEKNLRQKSKRTHRWVVNRNGEAKFGLVKYLKSQAKRPSGKGAQED
jgi:hypothetical protein